MLLLREVSVLNAARLTRLEASEPFAVHDAAPPANADARGAFIIVLFLLIVLGSISLVNWYFRYTYGV